MITLKDFRDLVRHLPPDTMLGISYDEEAGHDVIALRPADSRGGETVIDCGLLDAVDEEE